MDRLFLLYHMPFSKFKNMSFSIMWKCEMFCIMKWTISWQTYRIRSEQRCWMGSKVTLKGDVNVKGNKYFTRKRKVISNNIMQVWYVFYCFVYLYLKTWTQIMCNIVLKYPLISITCIILDNCKNLLNIPFRITSG